MKILPPMRAIRQKCLDCSNGSTKAVRFCTMGDSCSLWPLRFGCRPATARKRFGARALDPDCVPDAGTPIEVVSDFDARVEK